jgi:transposase
MENYTDRQVASAVRMRIDWKYVLSLELTDPGFDFSIVAGSKSEGNSAPVSQREEQAASPGRADWE